MTTIKRVTRWETTDSKLHYNEDSARYHQQKIDEAEYATLLLEHGVSVGEILRGTSYPASQIDPILDSVTKDTELVISHWQCCDTPGYKVVRFLTGLRVRIYGDAGSWSGPYGGDETIDSLVCCVKETNRKTI